MAWRLAARVQPRQLTGVVHVRDWISVVHDRNRKFTTPLDTGMHLSLLRRNVGALGFFLTLLALVRFLN